MRLLIHSNSPWVKSGYGQQTAFLARHAKALGHDVAISAFYGLSGTETTWEGIPVFPAACRPNTYGMEMVPHFYKKWQADAVIILADAWVGADYTRQLANLNVANWIPIDAYPLSKRDETYLLMSGATPIAMSRFGERMLRDAKFEPLYLPHAIDTAVFRPADPEARRSWRAELGADDDTIIVGMNAANRDLWRKGFFEQFTAFAWFLERHPNSLLYVHSVTHHPQGLDLPDLARAVGIAERVLFPDQDVVVSGEVTSEMLVRNFYDLIDIYSGCALAEGFGIPIVEAQACGLPVAVTDASAMSELAGPYAVRVPGEPMWVVGHRGCWTKPKISAIESAYAEPLRRRAEVARGDAPVDYVAAACEFAAQYDEQRVAAEYLEPVLKDLEARYVR